jgi:biopolymer transport protein ExbB
MLEVLAAPFSALHTMRELGGPVVNYIFLACVLMWTIVIERYWYFRNVLPQEAARTPQPQPIIA